MGKENIVMFLIIGFVAGMMLSSLLNLTIDNDNLRYKVKKYENILFLESED